MNVRLSFGWINIRRVKKKKKKKHRSLLSGLTWASHNVDIQILPTRLYAIITLDSQENLITDITTNFSLC